MFSAVPISLCERRSFPQQLPWLCPPHEGCAPREAGLQKAARCGTRGCGRPTPGCFPPRLGVAVLAVLCGVTLAFCVCIMICVHCFPPSDSFSLARLSLSDCIPAKCLLLGFLNCVSMMCHLSGDAYWLLSEKWQTGTALCSPCFSENGPQQLPPVDS